MGLGTVEMITFEHCHLIQRSSSVVTSLLMTIGHPLLSTKTMLWYTIWKQGERNSAFTKQWVSVLLNIQLIFFASILF